MEGHHSNHPRDQCQCYGNAHAHVCQNQTTNNSHETHRDKSLPKGLSFRNERSDTKLSRPGFSNHFFEANKILSFYNWGST